MTNEEAKVFMLQFNTDKRLNPSEHEAVRVAIKALEQEPKETWSIKDVATTFERHGLMTEQEPCDDCISRAELLKAVDTWDKFGCDADTKLVPVKDCYVPYIHYDDVVKAIKGMPSIQPKPKTGHWINLEKTEYKGRVLPFWSRYKCSECGNHGQNDFYYCPICGAKMESEG